MTNTNVVKSERINLRLNPAIKRQIERAASFEGRTMSGFIVASAIESAERTIREYETFTPSRRDAERFFEALANPPAPNAKLRKALSEYGRRVRAVLHELRIPATRRDAF